MKRSFTLVELLVVLVIIGVVVTMTIPKMSRIILKSKMMKRVPVLEQIRLAEINYKHETGDYWFVSSSPGWNWLEGNDTYPGDQAFIQQLQKQLGITLPAISDYQGQYAGFVILQPGNVPMSVWWQNDPRFNNGKYAYLSYSSEGSNGIGDACIIMCYDKDLNVKRLSIKYASTTVVNATGGPNLPNDPVEDIVMNE